MIQKMETAYAASVPDIYAYGLKPEKPHLKQMIATLGGVWRDRCILERRSKIIG